MVEVPKLDQITDTSIATDWLEEKRTQTTKNTFDCNAPGQNFDGFTELVSQYEYHLIFKII